MNAIIARIKSPVVAAVERWIYSIMKSACGNRPCGQRGHSGQVSPTPEALTYPPINISENKTKSEENDRTFSRFIDYSSTTRVPFMYEWTMQKNGYDDGSRFAVSIVTLSSGFMNFVSKSFPKSAASGPVPLVIV